MAQFKSKIGLIAATVGSAVGLGTVWRFPAQTQAGGGAAFLLIYILFIFLLGVPVMLSEFAVGRAGRSDALGDYRILAPRTKWWMAGLAAIVCSYLILMFYMVVGGWTLEYLVESIGGGLYDGLENAVSTGERDIFFSGKMQQYVHTDMAPLLYTIGFVAVNIVILLKGVQKGIERMSNIMMPMLFLLLIGFCCATLSMPGAADGVSFFLKPDFSKITPTVCIDALGQALFSLSLGMGILITYAGYFPDSTRLSRTSVIVVVMTLVVALLMGLIIFPAVSSFGLSDHALGGTTLVFVTLPEVFAALPATRLWSTLFFLLLMVAALTSTVSIAEVSIRFMQDRFRMSRRRAVYTVLLPLVVFSAICSLSFGSLSSIKVCGMIIFDFLDNVTNNYMLPLVALAGCLFAGWRAPRGLLKNQLSNNGQLRTPTSALTLFVIRYVAPAAILLILLFNL